MPVTPEITGIFASANNSETLYPPFRLGVGPQGTEFGGLETTADASVFVAPQERVYARLAYYF